jgi:hypothetical protein
MGLRGRWGVLVSDGRRCGDVVRVEIAVEMLIEFGFAAATDKVPE